MATKVMGSKGVLCFPVPSVLQGRLGPEAEQMEHVQRPVKVFGLEKPLSSKEIRNGTPLQYSCLENPMDGGAW